MAGSHKHGVTPHAFPCTRAALAPAVAAALLLAVAWAAVAVPSASAQSPGDEQYADPLAGGDDGDGAGSQDDAPPAAGAPPAAYAPPAAGAPPDGAQTAQPPTGTAPADMPPAAGSGGSEGTALPRTGGDAPLLAATGLALAALGLLLRPRPAARGRP